MITKQPNECENDVPSNSKIEHSSSFICGVVEGFYGRPWTSEQRRKLFKRVGNMGMDTYVYAPKDDCKHRVYWREMYSVEEAEHLKTLIEASESNNVSFVYAISPGLDMAYSNSKEVSFLKRKLEQVASFGCKSFAVLFDDIDIDMCESDKAIFQSFAHAQVSVSNEVYQHLGQPSKFFFCPTEYCASRAVPNVADSDYLNTIGSRLLPGIDIMWTGPKVISKKITIKSIEEVSQVLRRPPLIWDNIHANDYDPKRIFLGPYDGRSPELIPYLRGVLTNPNCEFEGNFIALHTLAQWSKSNPNGVKKDCCYTGSSSPVAADIRLETDGEYVDDEDGPLDPSLYRPRQALTMAISDWMTEIYDECSAVKTKMAAPCVPTVPIPGVPPMGVSCTNPDNSSPGDPYPAAVNLNEIVAGNLESAINSSLALPTSMGPVNSLLDPPSSDSEPESGVDCSPELMDYSVTPGSSPVITLTGPSRQDCESVSSSSEDNLKTAEDSMLVDSDLTLDNSRSSRFSLEDVYFLVDLFYTPFEHGTKATELLLEFHWLKVNAHCIDEAEVDSSPEQQALVADWHHRGIAFRVSLRKIKGLLDRLCEIPNQAIVQDLYPYLWDMSNTVALVDTFTNWLAMGHMPYSVSVCYHQGCSPYTWANKMYRDHFMNGDQEPWIFRGGLQAEFQRMLPFDNAADLLVHVCPTVPQTTMMQVRPYTTNDKCAVYEVCRRTCDDGSDGTDVFPDHPDLLGDRLVGGYLELCPEFTFVIEDEHGVCGYVVSALDSKEFAKKMEVSWLPSMRLKYPKTDTNEPLTPAEEMMCGFYTTYTELPETLYLQHPSVVRIDMLADRMDRDPNAIRRALASAIASLKVNGSHGLHTHVNIGDQNTCNNYSKLGFHEMATTSKTEDLTHLVRVI